MPLRERPNLAQDHAEPGVHVTAGHAGGHEINIVRLIIHLATGKDRVLADSSLEAY